MAKRQYEIEVREITDGTVTEANVIKTEPGTLLTRAIILGDDGKHSVLSMVSCDDAEACAMIATNQKARMLARVTTLGLMIHNIATDDLDDDANEEEETDNVELGESQGEKPENP